jgi:hypothetical protein
VTDVWRWYTKARRFPALIGKDASGRRIPGGPYTVLQVVAVPVAAVLLWNTQGLWGSTMSGLARVIIVIAGTLGAVKLLGKVDFASRNPIYLTSAYALQAFGSLGGRLGQTWVRPQRLSKVHSRISVATATASVADPGLAGLEATVAVRAEDTSAIPTAPTASTPPTPPPAVVDAPAGYGASAAARTTGSRSPASDRPATAPSSYTTRSPAAAATAAADPASSGRPVTRPARTTSDAGKPRRTGLEAFLANSSQKDAA